MLYTISTSPFYCDFAALSRLLRADDEVLLIQDAVLAASHSSQYLALIQQKNVKVFALREDVEARGLQNILSTEVPQLSYLEFVRLTVKHLQHFAW